MAQNTQQKVQYDPKAWREL